jgi:hypothetical protein
LIYGQKGLLRKSLFRQWPVIDNNAIKRLEKSKLLIAPLSLIAVRTFRGMQGWLIQVLAQPFNFRRQSTS